jgi:hypothetical protein
MPATSWIRRVSRSETLTRPAGETEPNEMWIGLPVAPVVPDGLEPHLPVRAGAQRREEVKPDRGRTVNTRARPVAVTRARRFCPPTHSVLAGPGAGLGRGTPGRATVRYCPAGDSVRIEPPFVPSQTSVVTRATPLPLMLVMNST